LPIWPVVLQEDGQQLRRVAAVLVVRLGLDAREQPRQDTSLGNELCRQLGVEPKDVLENAEDVKDTLSV
jgi:hypothetical protein